jgi:hypothetical protein
LYQAAKDAGHQVLGAMFYSASTEKEKAPSERDRRQYELTLGHRKTRARSHRREVLQRLLAKPEPEVIEIMLSNSHLTEADVVQLAARRPADTKILRQIFSAPQWIARHSVKRALVFNPETPLDLSIRLLSLLPSTDLKEIVNSGNTPELLRDLAQQTLAEERTASVHMGS